MHARTSEWKSGTSTPAAGGLPDVLFWKVLSFWRSSRDDDDYVPPRPDDY